MTNSFLISKYLTDEIDKDLDDNPLDQNSTVENDYKLTISDWRKLKPCSKNKFVSKCTFYRLGSSYEGCCYNFYTENSMCNDACRYKNNLCCNQNCCRPTMGGKNTKIFHDWWDWDAGW